MCQQQLDNYEKCATKVERSVVIHRIVLTVMAGSPTQTGFVNRDKTTGRWHFIGMTRARERVGYVLRRAISDKKAKREKAKNGETEVASPKKKTTSPSKKKKNSAKKQQEKSGIASSVASPSKIDAEGDPASAAAKSLAMRRRKLPIGLTRKTSASSLEMEQDDPKRRRTFPETTASPPASPKEAVSAQQSAGLNQAIAIAKPSAAEIASDSGIARPTAAYSMGASSTTAAALRLPGSASFSPSLYAGLAAAAGAAGGGANDIYLEAAIREHASWRERSAIRESAALRELSLREQAADAILRERIAMREHASIRERLALHEDAMMRERIALHEDAILRERLALQERFAMMERATAMAQEQQQAADGSTSKTTTATASNATAEEVAKKAGGKAASKNPTNIAPSSVVSSSLGPTGPGMLTPAQRAAVLGGAYPAGLHHHHLGAAAAAMGASPYGAMHPPLSAEAAAAAAGLHSMHPSALHRAGLPGYPPML